jgi:hypothetical protein
VEAAHKPKITGEQLVLAQRALDATPTLETQVRELGEENATIREDGTYEVRAKTHKDAYLLKEMFQDRHRAEQKLSDSIKVPEVEVPRVTGRLSFTGGWLPNARERAEMGE